MSRSSSAIKTRMRLRAAQGVTKTAFHFRPNRIRRSLEVGDPAVDLLRLHPQEHGDVQDRAHALQCAEEEEVEVVVVHGAMVGQRSIPGGVPSSPDRIGKTLLDVLIGSSRFGTTFAPPANTMPAVAFQRRLLERAAEIAGGRAPLSIRLGVHEHSLALWADDRAAMPGRIFLALADLILEDDLARVAQDRREKPRAGTASNADLFPSESAGARDGKRPPTRAAR